MTKKKSNQPSEFSIDSTRYCDVCSTAVRIGTGGEANWNAHVKSRRHEDNLPSLSTRQISSFFQKQTPRTSFQARPSDVPILSNTLPKAPLIVDVDAESLADPALSPVASSTPAPPSTQVPTTTTTTGDAVTPVTRLLAEITQLERNLPSSIPHASLEDPLAQFVGDPVEASLAYEDPFEMVNKTLHSVFGYDASPEEMSKTICRGEHGVKAFVNWIARCMGSLKVSEGIFESRLERFRDAMKLCCFDNSAHVAKDVAHELSPSSPSPPPSLARPLLSPSASSAPAVQLPVYTPCLGHQLIIPDTSSPFSSYPILLHQVMSLPWSVHINQNGIFLRSNNCSNMARHLANDSKPPACLSCAHLHDHNVVMGIRHRLLDGAHESTPWAYLTPAQMFSKLEHKTSEVSHLKLQGLNTSRALMVRNRQIDAWKRLVMGMSNSDIPRLRQLLEQEQKQGHSVFSMIEKVNLAANHMYRPLGYQEADYQRTFVIYCLGGRAAANIAHRTLGIPSIDAAKQHISSQALKASPGMPTKCEMKHNLNVVSSNLANRCPQCILGTTMQIDEIKIQERLRWDPKSNMILGVCREHGHHCALEFCSTTQADDLLLCLKEGHAHLASEATVVAYSILSKDPHQYAAKPFILSGSCKRETIAKHESLLRTAAQTLSDVQTPLGLRLYCICSDGDSRRRRAMINICLNHPRLSTTSPIYDTLSSLPLFNTACGMDDVTLDFDWKHVFKRFRNTLLRQKGFSLHRTYLSPAIIRSHIIYEGLSASSADAILAPNDKQDVVLMVKLLYAISNLPSPADDAAPTVKSSRRMLRLLGQLYFHLLQPYLNVTLSLHEQLSHLSAAAHLMLALYNIDKGEFVPVQLYFDSTSMIKNIYFCVAKTQVDDPDGSFWSVLLGTDGLEKIFGKIRTMIGGDTNADQYQLANRVDGAIQCVNILEEHPDWGGDPRRLAAKPLPVPNAIDDITAKYDHINPRSMTGNLRVQDVVLKSCWLAGRRQAEQNLSDALIDPPFTQMENNGGFDILCPFGGSCMTLVDGSLTTGEREETDEELGLADEIAETPTAVDLEDVPCPEDLVPDFDDIADEADVQLETGSKLFEAWVSLPAEQGRTTKMIHKATILRLYSSPLTIAESKDRLRRVRGYSRYNEPNKASKEVSPDGIPEDSSLTVEDPVISLVRCNTQVFLAVVQILSIRVDSKDMPSISSSRMHEPNVTFHGQILHLHLCDTTHQPLQSDWEWSGAYVPRSAIRMDGRMVELVNPNLQKGSRGRNAQLETYGFSTSELRGFAALLYERHAKSQEKLPEVKQSDTFPYRTASGEACFVCERDSALGDRRREAEYCSCQFCAAVVLDDLEGPALLKHMGAHILHDPRCKDTHNLCGFCLGTDCVIYLIKRGRTTSINQTKSQCPSLRKISLQKASQFKITSPCTNHPIRCPLCPTQNPAIWKYNLYAHIIHTHSTANHKLYEDLYHVSDEEITLLKAAYLDKTIKRKRKRNRPLRLAVSASHSSRMVLSGINDNEGFPDDEDLVDNEGIPNDEGLHDDEDLDIDDDDVEEDEEDHEDDDEDMHDHGLCNVNEAAAEQEEDSTMSAVADSVAEGDENPGNLPEGGQIDAGELGLASDRVDLRRSGRNRSRKRMLTDTGDDTSNQCGADGCSLPILGEELLGCSTPGCDMKYHLSCMGLLAWPSHEWFCDDECRKNAGYRVGGPKRRRK